MEDKNNNLIDDNLENERAIHELDRDRAKWRVRRRMAVSSFVALVLFGVYYALVGLFIDSTTASTVSEFNSIVVSVIGALTSLLLGYYGTAYFSDRDNKVKKEGS